jgi:hypothetical protein
MRSTHLTPVIPADTSFVNKVIPDVINPVRNADFSSDVTNDARERLGLAITPEQMIQGGSKIEDNNYYKESGQSLANVKPEYFFTSNPTSSPTAKYTGGSTENALPNNNTSSPTSSPTAKYTGGSTENASPNNNTYSPTSSPTTPAAPLRSNEKDNKNLLEIISGVLGGLAVIGASALAYFKLKRGEGNAAPEAPTAPNYGVLESSEAAHLINDVELGNRGVKSSQNNSPNSSVQNPNVAGKVAQSASSSISL